MSQMHLRHNQRFVFVLIHFELGFPSNKYSLAWRSSQHS